MFEIAKLSRENLMPRAFWTLDIEERLIEFCEQTRRLAEALPKTPLGNFLATRLRSSVIFQAPNYGAAQNVESHSAFLRDAQMCLRELRENRVWLLLMAKNNFVKSPSQLHPLINENNQLISILAGSVKTAKQKRRKSQ
jgi:four helix bundle protein